jgi:hypothetical protein
MKRAAEGAELLPDDAFLDTVLGQRIVGAACLAFRVDASTRLHGGDNSVALDLYDRERDAHLAKVYSERLAWKMAKEVLVYDLLSHAPVPTPKIVFGDDTRRVIDANYALMAELDGKPASTVTPTASREGVREIFRQRGTAAVAVTRWCSRSSATSGVRGSWTRRSATGRTCGARSTGTFAPSETRAATSRWPLASSDGSGPMKTLHNCHQPVLCHDDLHEQNVLVEWRDGRWVVTGAVDVENAVAADPLLDLAKTELLLRGGAGATCRAAGGLRGASPRWRGQARALSAAPRPGPVVLVRSDRASRRAPGDVGRRRQARRRDLNLARRSFGPCAVTGS